MRIGHEELATTNPARSSVGAGSLRGRLPDAFSEQLAPADGVLSPSVIKAAHLLVAGALRPATVRSRSVLALDAGLPYQSRMGPERAVG